MAAATLEDLENRVSFKKPFVISAVPFHEAPEVWRKGATDLIDIINGMVNSPKLVLKKTLTCSDTKDEIPASFAKSRAIAFDREVANWVKTQVNLAMKKSSVLIGKIVTLETLAYGQHGCNYAGDDLYDTLTVEISVKDIPSSQ